MVHALKHYIFRIWVTIFIAWPLSLLILPVLQPYMDLTWIPLPVIAIWLLVFMTVGRILNRVGMNSVKHVISKATNLERLGVLRRAETTFRSAIAILDGVMLSPLMKKKASTLLAAHLARFYLARVDKNYTSEQFIISYLQAHPDDEDVAQNWLQQIETQGGIRKEHYDLLSHIGHAQPNQTIVQHLLARSYLDAHRTDFPALQTYRHVLNGDISAASDIIRQLAVLFINGVPMIGPCMSMSWPWNMVGTGPNSKKA
jgi:hypothetical protein